MSTLSEIKSTEPEHSWRSFWAVKLVGGDKFPAAHDMTKDEYWVEQPYSLSMEPKDFSSLFREEGGAPGDFGEGRPDEDGHNALWNALEAEERIAALESQVDAFHDTEFGNLLGRIDALARTVGDLREQARGRPATLYQRSTVDGLDEVEDQRVGLSDRRVKITDGHQYLPNDGGFGSIGFLFHRAGLLIPSEGSRNAFSPKDRRESST